MDSSSYEQKPNSYSISTSSLKEKTNNAQNQERSPLEDNRSNYSNLIQQRNNSTGLPHKLKQGMENVTGCNLDHVKVHYNSSKPKIVQAHAYAQGSDIHLASGQEKHLPHELGHVVQQMRGSVAATGSVNGEALNDDVQLESEADRLGLQAMSSSDSKVFQKKAEVASPQHTNKPSYTNTIQAMSISQEPKTKRLYALADNRDIACGMGTPNHELYVKHANQVQHMNQKAARSKLNFSAGKRVELFGTGFTQVKAGFKTNETVSAIEVPDKPSMLDKALGKHKVKNHTVNLEETYHKRVAPAVAKHSQEKRKAVLDKIKMQPWAANFKPLQERVQHLTAELELFKKLLIHSQTKEGFHDVVNDMELFHIIVSTIESELYSETATTEGFVFQIKELAKSKVILEPILGKGSLVEQSLENLIYHFSDLAPYLPHGKPVNMLLIHSANFEDAMLDSVKRGDPVFYRACDVMASTIMGNSIDNNNKEQLKIYGAGGNSNAFHYAAKVLESGSDWVTLESFAAGERDRKIIGLTDDNAYKNLDNTWNYMMYGSVRKKGSNVSEEDNYFELYTKLRYYLKGIKTPGEFRTTQRERLTSAIPKNALDTIFPQKEKSEEVWGRLVMNHIFNAYGKVKNASYLEPDYIALRLKPDDRAKAKAISDRLKVLYNTPSVAHPYIQAQTSNELRNILGWAAHMGLPIDPDQLYMTMVGRLAAGKESAQQIHDDSWKELMKSIVQNKK